MINVRATMLADTVKSRPKWNENLENDFNRTLRQFEEGSTEDREWFENDTNSLTSERKPWLRIKEAYQSWLRF